MAAYEITPAQLWVARLAHLSMEEIAAELDLAPRTVKAHLDEARRRLGVQHKRHLPQALRERGLL